MYMSSRKTCARAAAVRRLRCREKRKKLPRRKRNDRRPASQGTESIGLDFSRQVRHRAHEKATHTTTVISSFRRSTQAHNDATQDGARAFRHPQGGMMFSTGDGNVVKIYHLDNNNFMITDRGLWITTKRKQMHATGVERKVTQPCRAAVQGSHSRVPRRPGCSWKAVRASSR